MTQLLIQGGRVIDPASGRDETADVVIADGRITAIGRALGAGGARRIDASGCVVMPGLVDLAARLREPGHEHEGMLESELRAAAAGGVTSLVCPPDTDPPLDEPGLVEMLKFRARKLSSCRLFPLGALTRGLAGEVLTEMAELSEAGCVGFSQADAPVRDTMVLLRALQYAATFGHTVWLRPQDSWLGQGVAASGAVATRLGLSGVPVAAETVALHTIIELVRTTSARVHLCRLSSAAGVALVRQAKREGLPISADVSVHSLHLTDVDIVDNFAETLCGGSRQKYLYKGKCTKMEKIDAGVLTQGTKKVRVVFYRTVHGPVVGYANRANGSQTVAIARKRSSYGQDVVDQAFFQQMTFGRVKSFEDFRKAAQLTPQTFNSFYADDKHIGFYTSGKLPLRRAGSTGGRGG